MMPEGWHITELGSIASLQSGGTPSKERSEYWGGEFPWVSAKDLKKNVITDAEQHLTEKGKRVAKVAEVGSVLILVRGMTLFKDLPIGYVAKSVAFNQDIKALIPCSETDGRFLAFTLEANKHRIRRLIDTAGHGTGRLDSQLLREYPLLKPPFKEQKKIAQILSIWDQAVELLEALTAAKRQRKKALMQQLLTGKKRISGFTDEWQTHHLGDLFVERVEISCTNLPLLSITREQGVIYREEVDRKDTSSADKSNYLRICPGDMGYNTMRMWQGVSALSRFEGIVSPAYTVCTPKAGIDGQFMAYLFKFPPIIHLFERYSQGLVSDTWNLKFPHFAQIKVKIPHHEEQQKIAAILSAADTEIRKHQQQLEALKQQKKGLMQQLLTGKIRVKVEEEVSVTSDSAAAFED